MKTLKTRMFEAALYYLCDRKALPYIAVDWKILEYLNGSLNVDHNETDASITLNIDPDAVRNFEIVENDLIFNCKFSGVMQQCVVPTASIVAIYDKYDKVPGIPFNVIQDAHVQIEEKGTEEPEAAKVAVSGRAKKPNPFKVVK